MFGIMSTVFKHTFAEGIPGFESSFAGFNPLKGYSYIDRLAYRLPDSVASQGGLGLHVDCNPLQPCDDPAKWRPIQASVALTDCLTPSSGVSAHLFGICHLTPRMALTHSDCVGLAWPQEDSP